MTIDARRSVPSVAVNAVFVPSGPPLDEQLDLDAAAKRKGGQDCFARNFKENSID